MKVVIVGSGYVGLVSGACFADIGHHVVCVDSNKEKIELLNSGGVPIYEPGLDALIARNKSALRLSFSTDLKRALAEAEFAFIAVGTPTNKGGSEADLSSVYSAASQIAQHAQDGLVIVNKSTVPVGTGETVDAIVRKARPDLVFATISNPEFLKEGSAIGDFMNPDRVIIGCDATWAAEKMRMLYAPLRESGAPILFTGRNAAEVIKYAANAFLAIKISFINEIADFCEATSADVTEVTNGVGLDKRIGRAFLNPGPGFGGSCFPKDSLALLATAQSHCVNLRMVETSIAANDARKRGLGRRVTKAVGGDVRGKVVAILGLTFKANTDDMRDSPSLDLIHSLQKFGAHIRAYDPQGMEQAQRLGLHDIDYASDPYSCAADADVVVVVTEWREFQELDLIRLAAVVKSRTIVDLRNILSLAATKQAGFELHRLGARSPGAAVGHPIPMQRSKPVSPRLGPAIAPSRSAGVIAPSAQLNSRARG